MSSYYHLWRLIYTEGAGEMYMDHRSNALSKSSVKPLRTYAVKTMMLLEYECHR